MHKLCIIMQVLFLGLKLREDKKRILEDTLWIFIREYFTLKNKWFIVVMTYARKGRGFQGAARA